MKTLLFEIGTEELPARILNPGLEQLARKAEALLTAARIKHSAVKTYGTPRRMAIMTELAERQESQLSQQRGPALRVAFDEEGNPTKAALGFAKSQGVAVEALQRRQTESGVYLYAERELRGQETGALLPDLLFGLIDSLSFPHAMRWGERAERFPRPVRWLAALWGSEVVDFSWAGVHSDRFSRGHRFWGQGTVALAEAGEYLEKLRAGYVLADMQERRQAIQRGLVAKAGQLGGRALIEDDLLDEVNNLVEYPTVFAGSFDPAYLALPQEVIITPMRDQQRYFPVAKENGELLNAFLAVRNGTAENIEVVARGNERVLLARLEDARFYYQKDREKPLRERVEDLKEIVYHEKLGSLWEKTKRLEKLVVWLGGQLSASPEALAAANRAAALSKADLTTSMVGEFTELQGIMGREYALASGESEDVALAIAEQYLPRFASDRLPQTVPGRLLALADKVDAVVGCFRVGLVPTGSEDPYALRRAALGVLAILLADGSSLELTELLTYAESLYGVPEQTQNLKEFFWGRLKGIFLDAGWPHGLVNAVLAAPSSDVFSLQARGEAIGKVSSQPQFADLLVAYNRAANLAQKAAGGSVQEKLFVQAEERRLWDAFRQAEAELEAGMASGAWEKTLAALSGLREPLDAFFTGVLVMDKEAQVRENRLAVLRSITDLFCRVADFKLMGV